MRRLATSATPILSAACVIVLLAACSVPRDGSGGHARAGTSSDPRGRSVEVSTDDQALKQALEATRAVESGRVELTTQVTGVAALTDGPAGVESIGIVHRAAFDRRTRQAQAETDMSALAGALTSSGQPGAADVSTPTRMVADGDVVYSQIGPMADAYGFAPTDWVKIDRAVFVDQRIDSDTAALVLDPLAPLDLLRQRAAQVRAVGDEHMRGTPVTHLVARLDLAGAARTGVDEPAGLEATLERAGIDSQPIDVWLDGAGRVRRLRLEVDGATVGRGAPGSVVTTFELFDVGEPVEIELPDPGDVLAPRDPP